MLVLSRQRDQEIIVGDDIVATVVDVRGDKVRLGIDAPQSYAVYRKELYDGMLRVVRGGGLPPLPRKKVGHGMLVLSRQRDETLLLCRVMPYPEAAPDETNPGLMEQYNQAIEAAKVSFLNTSAEFTIVDIRGDKVRIGVNAPRDVEVHRREVYDQIKRERRAAAMSSAPAVDPKPTKNPRQEGQTMA